MILEHCVDIVSTLMNRLLPMLDKNGSLFEIVFSMAKSYLGKAKIEAPGQPSFCSMGMSLGMAWLCLGQLQFLMLCPKEGSFDSLGIATIELDGLQKMVSYGNMIFASNNQCQCWLTGQRYQKGNYYQGDSCNSSRRRWGRWRH